MDRHLHTACHQEYIEVDLMRTNFQMTDENITMVSGDTMSYNVIIRDQNGDAVLVDGATFRAKRNLEDVTPDISLSLNDGITQEDEVLTVRLAPADTSSLVGFFYYDMNITIDSDVFTLQRGMLQIEANV